MTSDSLSLSSASPSSGCTPEQRKILHLLAREYPSVSQVAAEIINLSAVNSLPKGTEHFMSDLHGESEAFAHILNNCSGVIREKVDKIFSSSMTEEEKKQFCTLIYYPQEKLEDLNTAGLISEDWYRQTLHRLIDLSRSIASKYTRSKVRRALPDDFSYIIDELLHTSGEEHDKQAYYRNIISTIIELHQADAFIIAMCCLVKRMAVDCLHIVGDIYDRGEHPDKIMDMLLQHHNVDIQWGNHDIVWMGAAAGSAVCIAAVLNSALQYNTLSMLESAYGISLRDLIGFAQETYRGCTWFMPRNPDDKYYVKNSMDTLSKAHKAIAIILFKLEGQLILRHPEYHMEHRLIFRDIHFDRHTVCLNGVEYPLNDCHFPTVNPADPYALSPGEQLLMQNLLHAFRHSVALRRHMDFLYSNGSIYKIHNKNLMFHGCIPMNEDGTFTQVTLFGEENPVSGRAYLDRCDHMARLAYQTTDPSALDFMYYLWCGKHSPLFGRDRMTTFERYFISDPSTWKEQKDPYYRYTESFDAVCRILREFGLNGKESHIINGHVPVRVGKGEHPVKAGGRYILIDGGFCKAYHEQTGIAGYTLIYSSRGLRLVSHEPFAGKMAAIRENRDIVAAEDVVFELMQKRMLVQDTDSGRDISEHLADLKMLLDSYLSGTIVPER